MAENQDQDIADALFDNLSTGLQLLDRDGRTVRVNAPFRQMFGQARADAALGAPDVRTDPPAPSDRWADALQTAFAGQVARFPSAMGAPGERRCFDVTLIPVKGDGDAVEGVIACYADVTRSQASERELAQRARQIAALQQASQRIAHSLEASAVLNNTVDAGCELVGCDSCAVWQESEADGVWRLVASKHFSAGFQARHGREADANAPSFGVLKSRQPVVSADVDRDPAMAPVREELREEGVRRLLAVPLQSGDAISGALLLCWREPGYVVTADIDTASLLADQTAVALRNADLYEQARCAATEAHFLMQTAAVLSQSLSLPDILRHLTETAAPLTGMHRMAVQTVDTERDEVCLIAYTGVDSRAVRAAQLDRPRRLSEQSQAIRHMVATGEPIVLDELPPSVLNELTEEQRRLVTVFDLRSVLIVPLRVSEKTIGYIMFDEPGRARHWTERDLRLARGVASQAAVAIRNARQYEAAQAMRDELTERVRESTEEVRAAHSEAVANEKLAAVGFMAKEVAHGLRNPLNVIATSTFYLRSRFPNPDEKVERHFDTISRYVDQSANTISQLMNLAGPSRPELAPVDVNVLAERALQDRFTSEDIECEANWGEGLPYVNGDATQLSHAVKALVGYVAGASANGTVRISTGRDEDMAVLAVGGRLSLSEEERRVVFEPFTASATQWTGLALSVAKQIATKHGGEIRLTEREDETYFCMRLPLINSPSS